MEMIASHLKLVESKQKNLRKAHEQLHSEASSFLLFSLQWKDLEQHFDSTRESILAQYEELLERDKRVALKEKLLDNVEKSIDECSKALELKKDELSKLNILIEKYDDEVRLKEKELDSAKEKLRFLSRDIESKEREANLVSIKIMDVEKDFENKKEVLDTITEKIAAFNQELELKEQRLNGIMQLIEERRMESEQKEKDVESLGTLLLEHEEALVTKEKQYDAIQMAIKESSEELKLKEKDLESMQNMIAAKSKEMQLDLLGKSIKLRTEELGLKQKDLVLMQSKLKDLSEDLLFKESELESIKTCIQEHSKELDMQERQLNSTQRSIQARHDEVILLTEYVSTIQRAIIECSKELVLKEDHLVSFQVSEGERSYESASVEEHHDLISVTVNKCLESLKSQKKRFHFLRKSIDERSVKLKNEEIGLKRRNEELNKRDEKGSKCLSEFELLKTDIASQMELLDKGREELRFKEIQYKVQVEQLESREKDIDLIRAFTEKFIEKAKVKDNSNVCHEVVIEESDCRPADCSNKPNFDSLMTIDGKTLLSLLCEHLKAHDLVCSELAIALQTSSNPAKLVLDALRWFYPPYIVTEATKFDVHNIKRACILLSELMLKVSPKITPPLKEEALKLASQWKAKIQEVDENHLEVVAFLLLVANFELAPEFNADELCILLNSVSHYKQAFKLGRALGIADKSPVANASHYLLKAKQSQSSANEAPLSSVKDEQLSINPNERTLHLLLNGQLNGLELTPNAIISTLKKSSDPARLVLDVIQGSFHLQLKKGQMGFESSSLSWCPLLLKQLMKICPYIDPSVREDAIKLAIEWKSNIRTDSDNYLGIIGFLQLLVSYGLTDSFSGEEILKLFEKIVLHEQAPELCAMFGFTQKIHDIVQNLIGTKQFVEAVRFICGYKMEGFRPGQILKEYLQDARNATLKASKKKNTAQEEGEIIDKEIDAVRSVITCIADCNLHSEIPSQGLENRIVLLEKMKAKKRTSEPKKEQYHLDRRNPSHVETQQPHSTKAEAQQPGKNKRKKDQMECPQASLSTRSSGCSNSSPSKQDGRSKVGAYDSRFVGMQGLFGLHDGGDGSSDHGNQHLRRPPWPGK